MTHTSYRQKRYTTRLTITWTVENLNRISPYTYRCCVYSAFLPRPPSVHCRHSRAARATPSNHTQRYASCNCSELAALLLEYTETICIARTEYESIQAATRCADRQYKVRPIRARAYIVWGDAAVAVRAGAAELATIVCRSSSDMACSDYASVIALRCQIS